MNAGQLKERISVWRNVGERNSYGEKTEKWVVVASVRAAVQRQNASKAMSSGEIWYPRAAVFRVRLGADVSEGDRVLHDGKYYDVVSVTEDKHVDRSITINTELHNE